MDFTNLITNIKSQKQSYTSLFCWHLVLVFNSSNDCLHGKLPSCLLVTKKIPRHSSRTRRFKNYLLANLSRINLVSNLLHNNRPQQRRLLELHNAFSHNFIDDVRCLFCDSTLSLTFQIKQIKSLSTFAISWSNFLPFHKFL